MFVGARTAFLCALPGRSLRLLRLKLLHLLGKNRKRLTAEVAEKIRGGRKENPATTKMAGSVDSIAVSISRRTSPRTPSHSELPRP